MIQLTKLIPWGMALCTASAYALSGIGYQDCQVSQQVNQEASYYSYGIEVAVGGGQGSKSEVDTAIWNTNQAWYSNDAACRQARFMSQGLRDRLKTRWLDVTSWHCVINIYRCPKHPSYRGTFNDTYQPGNASAAGCSKRPKQYQDWCGTNDAVYASYYQRGSVVGNYSAKKR